MVYHRKSFNYHVSIMMLRRTLISLLLLPGGARFVTKVTGEPEDVLRGHTELLDRYGTRYIRNRAMFLSHNTDGPGNELAKAYSRDAFTGMLVAAGFRCVTTDVRYLNLRLYPGGLRFSSTGAGERVARRMGWHLYAEGTKAGFRETWPRPLKA